ncbi:DUF4112 domain-containing protein [Fulvivirga sediminis]|uniref:DUF4112 domain-containing protein n=1 Tax=Fulvivirga sediminis TaxID=2803949 RepID=A0A937FBC0_9BACT|nr:DUF4112 domain-containing protein [Fulvivirga sediminis]MBL3658492.1 DUF4112 domain-containing protein [Fulvivirga sediminis]
METIITHPSSTKNDFEHIEKISNLLDSKFTIPGTKIRFGLDPIFSLIPVLGDAATFFISSLLVWHMSNHGASQKVVVKMMGNVAIDTLIGSIPLIGTVFDVFFRCNNRNVKLLKEHYQEGKHQGSGKGIIVCWMIIGGAIILILCYAILKLLVEFFQWLF